MTGKERRPKLLTRVELARALRANPRTVAKWLEEGLPVKTRGRGGRASLYDEAEARAWLAVRNAAETGGSGMNWAAERARKEHWQALLAEQSHRVRERELLPAADVERAWSAHIAAVRTKLLAWPATLSDRLHRAATLEGLAGLERVLHDAVRDTLRELAGEEEAPAAPAAKTRPTTKRAHAAARHSRSVA